MFFPICLCTFTMWTPTFILLNELCQSIGFTYWVNFLSNIYDQKNSCTLFYEDSNHIGKKSLHYISCTSVNYFFDIQFLISFDTISEFKTFVKSIELIKSWPSWLDLLWNCYQIGKLYQIYRNDQLLSDKFLSLSRLLVNLSTQFGHKL